MPTVHREGPFRFVIWPDDHRPPHVHCFRGNEEVVIFLESGEVRNVVGMQERDVTRAIQIVHTQHQKLLASWRQIHGF